MKRRWKKFLAGVLSAALALNLAAPLALAGSSTIGAACSVTSVFLYPEYVGRVDGENVSCIQGEVSYDHGLLTFHGDVTLTTVGVADLGTVPLVKALSEKNLRLVANGKVTGRTKGNGIEEAKEIAGGEYNLTYADLGAYLDTKPNGILGGDTGTTITAGTEITLKDFHTGIDGGNVQIDGKVTIKTTTRSGSPVECGIANFTTMNPGSDLVIYAQQYIGEHGHLTYNGGHLLMNMTYGNPQDLGLEELGIGENVGNIWCRTSKNDAFTKIDTNVQQGIDDFYAVKEQNSAYLELTDVDPYQQESDTYDLWVAGKQVTETNQNDVLGDGGSVKFDPDTHTLTLSDAHLTLGEDAEGDVSGCIDSELAEELTITGTATLSNADGILTDGPLTLKNADLTLTGNNEDGGEEAIRAGRSDEDITIQNSKVTIAGTNAEGNFFNFGIRCGKLTVANSTLDVKVYGSAIEADELKASGAGTVITAETDSQNEEDYAIELNNENSLTMNDGLVLVEGEVNKSRKAKIAQPEQAPTDYTAYWVVRPGDTPQRGMQFPGAIIQNDDERHLFAGWFLEDGTRLEDSPYYMGPGVDHVDNIDRDVTFYGRWCTAEQLRTLTFEGGTVAVNSGLKMGYTAEESPVKLAPGSRVTLTLDESKAADHRFVIDPIPADWTTSGRTATFTMPDADTTVTVEQRAENPANYKVYWVVHPGDEPVNGGMQIPGAIFGSEEEERLFEGWFLEDGTRLEDSPYYMGPGVDHVGNLDRDVTFYGHWRTAESGEGSPDGGDGFGTLLAVGAVVGVAGVVAYQVGTELILDQLLPAGVAVPHTRAELAMFLWNTAGRPAPATLPAFADVADPELAQAAQWAIEQGYLKARADGSFKPDKGVAKWRVIRGYRAVTEP